MPLPTCHHNSPTSYRILHLACQPRHRVVKAYHLPSISLQHATDDITFVPRVSLGPSWFNYVSPAVHFMTGADAFSRMKAAT